VVNGPAGFIPVGGDRVALGHEPIGTRLLGSPTTVTSIYPSPVVADGCNDAHIRPVRTAAMPIRLCRGRRNCPEAKRRFPAPGAVTVACPAVALRLPERLPRQGLIELLGLGKRGGHLLGGGAQVVRTYGISLEPVTEQLIDFVLSDRPAPACTGKN